jgi:topoisomerase-4 subunit B
MMMALGIEENVENLRYSRIILATDADYDGFHIRNLLLTFFLNYFEELMIANRMYILETPLFRVRNKQQILYCYSEKEKQSALQQINPPAEITRFKGLGEISPKEFGQFINENIRLLDVNVKSIKEIPPLLEFYMGKNTPTRRDYIMENLI